MFRGSLGIGVIILITVSLAWAAPVEKLTPPTWPQSFSLEPGDKIEYSVPMTQAGTITVDVKWSGSPLAIVIRDPDGKAVTAVTPQNAPTARISCNVSAADLGKGSAWNMTIFAPGKPMPRAQAAANGQVTIQSPASDQLKVQGIRDAIVSQRQAKSKALIASLRGKPAPAKTNANTSTPVTLPGGSKMTETALRARMSTRLSQYTATITKVLATAKSSAISINQVAGNTANGPAAAAATKHNTPPGLKAGRLVLPIITSVSPTQGMPGNHITITGKNIPEDKSQSEVIFNIGSGIEVAANIVTASKTGDLATYDVQMLGSDSALQPYDGGVYVRIKDGDITSEPQKFHFIPLPLPAITDTDPATPAAGDSIRIDGANFKQGEQQVHFIINGSDTTLPSVQFFSAQQMMVKVPDYSAKQPTPAQMYITDSLADIKGPLYGIVLKPTVPVVENLEGPAGQMNDPLLIDGSGFRQPVEVHFVTHTGQDKIAKIAASDECSILTTVPEVIGTTSDVPWQIYVKSNNMVSNKVNFTFKPTLVTMPLNFTLANIQGDNAFKGDHFDWARFCSDLGMPYIAIYDGVCSLFDSLGSTDSWTNDDTSLQASHTGGFFDGHKDDDEFFRTYKLKNGWVVDNIDFKPRFNPDEAGASIWDSKIGTDSPYVKIHWWDSPMYDQVSYSMSITVKGPIGTSYQ